MSTSPFGVSDAPASGPDVDLRNGDQLFDQEAEDVPVVHQGVVIGDVDPEAELDQAAYAEDSYEPHLVVRQPRSTVYASLPGMPGRGVVLLTSFVTAGTAGLDFALTGGLTYFFDLTFVVVCLVAAMAVRGHDLFTTGVLPPIAFGVTVGLVAMVSPATFVAAGGGFSQVFLTGLTAHAGALVFGYGTALVTVAARAAHHRRR